MIKNYLKIAIRNFKKQKVYSLITMSGLVLGLGVFILFALATDFLSSFDSFHKKADSIYSVVQVIPYGMEEERHSAIAPAPLIPALLSEFPEIERAARLFPAGRMIVKQKDKIFYENGVRFVDSDFLSIFSFEMITGETEKVLDEPYSIVLTEDSAEKYFGDEDPLGKTLILDNKIDVVVTGIIENVPMNSSISFDFLVSMGTARALYPWMNDWSANKHASFLLLSEDSKPEKLEGKFSSFIDKYYGDSPATPTRFYLHPLSDFFLGSEGIDCYWNSGRFSFVTIWIVAVLILIIACINFMNLSTARYAIRANEVGMRKVIGASRIKLLKQFLGESTLSALIALPAAVLFYELIRPVFVANVGQFFDVSLWDRPHVLALVFGMTILTGIFAGSYPAFYLSAFEPVQVIKGRFKAGKKGSRFRKVLVVVQFTFSIILILMTIISIKQSDHNLNIDLGYNRTGIIAVQITSETRQKLEMFKKELVQHNDIVSVSASAALPIEWDAKRLVIPEGRNEENALEMNVYGVDHGFIEMLDIDLRQGRSFSIEHSDSKNILINETAVKELQWDDPIGNQIMIGDQKGMVIGVTKDFHFKSIFLETISPALLYLEPEELNYMFVKHSTPSNISGVLEYIREKWKALAADLPFEYTTLADSFLDAYRGDKTAEMAGMLGAMAIFLSCLGLFGLSSYAVERRMREIGIRKVLGASVPGIVRMLIKEFIKLVAIANIIAIPVAYFSMNSMIRFIYAYPIVIGPGIFIVTVVLTLFVAFLTVSSQTIRSALANPVDSLKYE
jgi:putative ABC transport system permease protein